ncbi:MAG: type III pantothenate kinase [Deltaproteobacteria bacterium]|nr:type III pantothenate kinase [Deltaproteobacteria bacterium]
MLLAMDVGNTNTVFGIYRGAQLIKHFRIESVRTKTADEYGVLVENLLSRLSLAGDEVSAAIVASTVPSLGETFVRMLRTYFEIEPVVVGPGLRTGMPILYEPPRDVGPDRIVNAVAAFERLQSACIVVDFGTATTFDVVSPRGEFLGGIIAPGLQVAAEALFTRAAKLPRVELACPPKTLGKNTVHAMQSGLVYGHAALVDGLVTRLMREVSFDPIRVIATGGYAQLIAPLSERIESVDVWLTLDGLRILYERNRGGHDGAR